MMMESLSRRIAFAALQGSVFKYERLWATYSSIWLRYMQGL